jgi:hypothetical protein
MSKKKTSQKVTVDNNPTTRPPLEIKLISYTVEAVIPTMMYGNIQPKITVEARTMEDAKLAVFPHIEDLYRTYAVEPMDGRKPAFMSKANVSVSERTVDIAQPQNTTSTGPTASSQTKSVAFMKADGAIKSATSLDALDIIQQQIEKSVKLSADEKPILLDGILKRIIDLS